MADIPEFEEYWTEDEETIRDRLDTDADPILDLREGNFYQMLTEPGVKELARIYSSLNDALQQGLVAYAVGEALDFKAAEFGLERRQATQAEGEVTFTGTDGTLIPQGTRVSVPAQSDQQESIRFLTDSDVTIAGGTATVEITAEEAGVAGNVAAAAIEILEDAITGLASVTNTDETTGGSDIEDDDTLRDRILLEANAPEGSGNVSDYTRWALSRDGVGAVTVVPVWDGPNTVRVVLLDVENNPVGDTIIEDVQRYLSGTILVSDPTSAPTAALGGAGAITDTLTYKYTFLDANGGETAPSDASASVSPAAQEVDLTGIAVSPNSDTVARRVYRASSSDPDKYELVTEIADNTTTIFTDNLASVAGNRRIPKANNTTQFDGQAPIGAWVTVDTPDTVAIDIVATVVHETGYSLDGNSGTIATEDQIEAALAGYFDQLIPGEDVIYNNVIAQFFDVTGVFNVTGLTVDGGGVDVSIDDAEVATLGTVTLS